MLWLLALRASQNFFNANMSRFGVADWLETSNLSSTREWIDTYGPKFKEFLSYVYYFIPSSYLAPFFSILFTLAIVRIIFAAFRIVTDIL